MLQSTVNISQFSQLAFKAYLYLQDTIELNQDDYELTVESLNQNLNEGTYYEVSNTSIGFSNKDYWASHRFYLEAPLGKRVDIYMIINDTNEVMIFSGIVDAMKLEPHWISLTLLA